ncbi:MAG: isochorismatase family protein [Bacteroidales bacterium]|nr:isochorismatase family protein [Bacteroidales bacterium]
MRKYPGFALVQAALVTAAMTACCGGGSKCKSDSSSTAGTVADVSSVLVVVDVQRDFFSPEGSLYVSGSEELPAKIAEAAGNYDAVIFTLDWHPGNHCSFASEGGQWPSHCVAFTQGAGLADEFAPVLAKGDGKVFIFKKGQEQDKEQYGAFEGGLEGTVKDWFESADKVDVCGIAGDYCVKETAANILKYVPSSKVTILTDLVRSIDGGAALAQFIKDNSLNEQ